MIKRLLLTTAFSTLSAAAYAQAPATPAAIEGGVPDIVVTAERRESNLQRTPLAISAFDEKSLVRANIRDVQDVAQTAPGLSYTKVSNFVQLNIRGIGLEQINLGGEPGVALHIDGIYAARPFVGDAVFSDLARVEVLRGPQGTLYGRNATGGSVNLISNAPTREFEGSASATYGNYNRLRLTGVISGPLTEGGTVRARLSGSIDQHDGYLLNLVNNKRVDDSRQRSLRGQFAFDLGERATLTLGGDWAREGGTGPVFKPGSIPGTAAALGGQLTADPHKLYADGPFGQNIRAWGVSARLDIETDAVKIMSLSGYRDSKFRLISDLDGTDFFLINEDLREAGKQFSQEVQLSSQGDGRFQWLLGSYYFHEDGSLNYAFPVPLFGTTITFDAQQKTNAFAAFGQASYQLTDTLKFTAGLRWSHDRKKGSTIQNLFGARSVNVAGSWSALTPRFVLEWQATPGTMLYASAARGFKAGGLNTTSLQANAYDPEYVWNYEIGLKSRFLDNRVQTNLAAFYYTYTDLQVNQFAVGQTFIQNAASAKGKGIEAEITARPTDALTLSASLAYLDATFSRFLSPDSFRPTLGVLNLAGNDLPRSPKFSANLAAQYDIPLGDHGRISLRGEYAHRDRFYFTPFNTSYARGGGYDLLNARIAYATADDKLEVAVFGRNLTDQSYEQTITVSGINAGTLVLFAPPRTYGAEVRVRY